MCVRRPPLPAAPVVSRSDEFPAFRRRSFARRRSVSSLSLSGSSGSESDGGEAERCGQTSWARDGAKCDADVAGTDARTESSRQRANARQTASWPHGLDKGALGVDRNAIRDFRQQMDALRKGTHGERMAFDVGSSREGATEQEDMGARNVGCQTEELGDVPSVHTLRQGCRTRAVGCQTEERGTPSDSFLDHAKASLHSSLNAADLCQGNTKAAPRGSGTAAAMHLAAACPWCCRPAPPGRNGQGAVAPTLGGSSSRRPAHGSSLRGAEDAPETAAGNAALQHYSLNVAAGASPSPTLLRAVNFFAAPGSPNLASPQAPLAAGGLAKGARTIIEPSRATSAYVPTRAAAAAAPDSGDAHAGQHRAAGAEAGHMPAAAQGTRLSQDRRRPVSATAAAGGLAATVRGRWEQRDSGNRAMSSQRDSGNRAMSSLSASRRREQTHSGVCGRTLDSVRPKTAMAAYRQMHGDYRAEIAELNLKFGLSPPRTPPASAAASSIVAEVSLVAVDGGPSREHATASLPPDQERLAASHEDHASVEMTAASEEWLPDEVERLLVQPVFGP